MNSLFLLILPMAACSKVIQVNIHNAAPQIVINGEVTNQPGPYQVSITSSVEYSADNIFPAVSGAAVTIRDDTGLTDSLRETSPGIYSTGAGWQGQPGHTYTLTVESAGATYTATSTMPEPVILDSVGFQQESRGRKNEVLDAVPYFQDPAGIANYYRFTETIDGIPLDRIFIFSDRLSDGKYIRQPARDDSAHLQPGDQLDFSMSCIDKNVYQYLFELNQIADANRFSSVTPANPASNISHGALGIFSAHTIQSIQTTVH